MSYDDSTNTETTGTLPGTGLQLRELLVFLFMVAPSMILSLFAVRQGTLSFTVSAYAIIFRDLGLVCLVAFFLWRNGEPRSCIGWRYRKIWPEIWLGVVLFCFLAISASYLDLFLKKMGLTSPSTQLPTFLKATDWKQFVLAFLLVAVVAVAEETIFRGYIILRLKSLTHSDSTAVLLSSIIFAFGHGYEGTAGMATVGYMGLVFAIVYIWRKNLAASVTMHFLQDFAGIILIPLLERMK